MPAVRPVASKTSVPSTRASSDHLGADALESKQLGERIGPGDPPSVLEATIANAQEVLSSSNTAARNGADPLWSSTNGSTDQLVPTNKPRQFKAGIELDENGQPVWNDGGASLGYGNADMGISFLSMDPGDDPAAAVIPAPTLADFRARLVADFDFLGGVSGFKERDQGADEFAAAIVRRTLGGDPDLSQMSEAAKIKVLGIELLARNVWSYATRGADLSGKTDIGQMQGMLFTLDAQIALASNSNQEIDETKPFVMGASTNEQGETTVAGLTAAAGRLGLDPECVDLSDLTLHEADDVYGRATILQARHLMQEEGQHTHVFIDSSGSMKSEQKQLGRVLSATPIDGVMSITAFWDATSQDERRNWERVDRGVLTKKEKQEFQRLYESIKTTHDPVKQAVNKARFKLGKERGISARDVSPREVLADPRWAHLAPAWDARMAAASRYQELEVKAKEERSIYTPEEAGVVLEEAGTTQEHALPTGQGSNEESGVRAVLSMLNKQHDELEAAGNLPQGDAPTPYTEKILMVTDETDIAKLYELKAVLRLTRLLGYDIEIIFSTDKVGSDSEAVTFVRLDRDDLQKAVDDPDTFFSVVNSTYANKGVNLRLDKLASSKKRTDPSAEEKWSDFRVR